MNILMRFDQIIVSVLLMTTQERAIWEIQAWVALQCIHIQFVHLLWPQVTPGSY